MNYGKTGKTKTEGHACQGEKGWQLALQEKWDETKDDEKEVLKGKVLEFDKTTSIGWVL